MRHIQVNPRKPWLAPWVCYALQPEALQAAWCLAELRCLHVTEESRDQCRAAVFESQFP